MARPPPPNSRPPTSFAFGSSTPRELSHHISDIARKGLKAKLAEGSAETQRHDTRYYVRQAKSIDANEPTKKGRKSNSGNGYAFGSSTPRSLSHMSKVPRDQRVYDAKLADKDKRRTDGGTVVRTSSTNPQLSTATNRSKRSAAGRSISTESRNEADEDEAASEPDIVQHRLADFGGRNIFPKIAAGGGGGAAGVPKRDGDNNGTTTKTATMVAEERGRTKAKHSTAGGTVVPNAVAAGANVRKKTATVQDTGGTVQQRQQENKEIVQADKEEELEEGGTTTERHETETAFVGQQQRQQQFTATDAAAVPNEQSQQHNSMPNKLMNEEEEEEEEEQERLDE